MNGYKTLHWYFFKLSYQVRCVVFFCYIWGKVFMIALIKGTVFSSPAKFVFVWLFQNCVNQWKSIFFFVEFGRKNSIWKCVSDINFSRKKNKEIKQPILGKKNPITTVSSFSFFIVVLGPLFHSFLWLILADNQNWHFFVGLFACSPLTLGLKLRFKNDRGTKWVPNFNKA